MNIFNNTSNKKSLQDILNEAKNNNTANAIKNRANNSLNNLMGLINNRNAANNQNTSQRQSTSQQNNNQNTNNTRRTLTPTGSKEVFTKDHVKTFLQDNDVKKSNELVPTTFSISVNVKGERYTLETLLGVKVTAHLVDTGSMVDNIESIILGNRINFRFMQWYTGEIKFFRDFLFMIEEMKKNAISNSTKKNVWWQVLKDRAMSAKLRSANFLSKDKLLPNSTLLFTIDEIEEIKNRTNIDLLEDIEIVSKIMDHLFLLGMVIIDSSIEVVYFYFSGRDIWEKYAFSQLEKDDSNTRLHNAILLNMLKR